MNKKTIALNAIDHMIRVSAWARRVIEIGAWEDPPEFDVDQPVPNPDPGPVPQPTEPLYSVRITATKLNIRSAPGVAADNKVGLLLEGDITGVWNSYNSDEYTWLRVSPLDWPAQWVAASWTERIT